MRKWDVENVSNTISPLLLSITYGLLGIILIGYTVFLIFSTREIMWAYLLVVAVIGAAILLNGAYAMLGVIKPTATEKAILEFNEGTFVYNDKLHKKIVFTTVDIKKYKVFKGKHDCKVVFELKDEAINIKTKEKVKELTFKISTDCKDDFEQFMKNV